MRWRYPKGLFTEIFTGTIVAISEPFPVTHQQTYWFTHIPRKLCKVALHYSI